MPNRVKLTVSRDKNMPPEFVKVFGWLSYLTTYLTTYGKRTENFIVKIRAKRAEKGKILAKKSQNNAFLAEKRSRNSLGPRGTEFESPHFDHKTTESRVYSPLPVIFLPFQVLNYFF